MLRRVLVRYGAVWRGKIRRGTVDQSPRSVLDLGDWFFRNSLEVFTLGIVAKLVDQSLEGRGQNVHLLKVPMYSVQVKIEGVSRILFHRYDPEVVEQKSKAPKGSREKKTDNLESFLYRDIDEYISIPATNIKACLLNAAKHFSDPRSTGQKKQAKELFAASIFVEPEMCPVFVGGRKVKEPQFIDRRGAVVQRNRVNRERPGLLPGWQCEFVINVLAPEYISLELLRDVLSVAGRFVGLGDYRPDFGRFQVIKVEVTN